MFVHEVATAAQLQLVHARHSHVAFFVGRSKGGGGGGGKGVAKGASSLGGVPTVTSSEKEASPVWPAIAGRGG